MAAPNVFSVRIVSVDYYMAGPIPDLDISYSSFQGGKVNEVPVIRVFGSTPAGQKTCLHIHRALPYFYVPCSDVPMELHPKGDSYTHDIALAIEKALKLKGNSGSKRQHVHGCSLVQARKLYGYHSSEELFVKIYLYYPHDVSRAANLLLGGSVFDKCLQPHESHIPFILQFLVDYNLYGMGHLHVSKIKFRYPIPEVFSPRKFVNNGQPSQEIDKSSFVSTNIQADTLGQLSYSSPVWISSTIRVDWTWNSAGEFDGSSIPDTSCVKRQSICELEGDATVDEILNQQLKMYTSLSQTHSDVKMVQSLLPIWEEFERTGIYEAEIPPDSAKPLPEDVLKAFSLGLEFNNKLMKVHGEAASSLCQTHLRKDVRFVQQITSSEDEGNSVRLKNDNLIGGDAIGSQSTQDSTKDSDALDLLRWLATSQAAHDLNSDDELACETILSPLLPATTIDMVMEKANVDYETESQKECQDILDSVGELMDFEGLKEQAYDPSDGNRSSKRLYKHVIPQVDGSTDDAISTPCDGLVGSNLEVEGKSKLSTSEHQELQDANTSFNFKHKRKRLLWGSLPLSVTEKVKTEGGPASLCRETKEPVGLSSSSENEVGKHADIGASDLKETSMLDRCSVRDLMRRKRAHRVESAESGSRGVKEVLLVMQDNENTVLCPKHLDFQMSHADELDQKPHGSSDSRPADLQSVSHKGSEYDVKPTNLGCSLFGKLPLRSSSENTLHANTLDEIFYSNVRYDKEVGTGATSQRENSLTTGPFQVPSLNTRLWLSNPERLNSEAFLGCCETREKSGPEETLFVDQRFQLIDASASSCLRSYAVENQVSGRDGYTESGLEGLSSTGGVCKMFFENPVGANVVSVTTALNNERCCGHKPSRDSFSSGIRNSPSEVMYSDDKDLIALTFCRKPPDAEWKEGEFQNSSSLNGGRAMDDFLPYFVGDCQDETEIQNKYVRTKESGPHQEPVMGVPIHYQTDGSYLYLLTPATSPPSPKDVGKWLTSENKGSSRSLTGLHSSVPNDWDNTSLEYGSLHDVRQILPQGPQENHGNQGVERNPLCKDMTETVQREGDAVKVQTHSECSQDGSQISGPDGKSKLTPLSQIEFRDSASIGGGQQMTLLCIEVQAESRGDLRPDPRFDAINIISLAIQNDNDSGLEVHVLLRSKPESSRRSLDGTSGCKVLVFHEEAYLFNHFMKTVRSLDPDILMGWDIQGGSLGYLAERASHLGIGLLNKISRTPSETKTEAQGLEVCEKAIQDELNLQAVISDSVVPEDPVIEDEWGRTHASGVHVGGRIVLNVWRLIRGEVKLNMYTIEAVAQAVLRRKVPYISNKILTKWFTSGPGQARYRCLEYVNERVKLSLEIMNQLDMINRTSELARVFGIDFFSVLSRGSQYRVESMLLRLAHAQNYLAISPGNKQVASQPAMECIPLVMEPESGFYADPVVVLDFQSLYPSMIIAYNLCYSTCVGKIVPSDANILGVSSFLPDPHDLHNLKDQILVTPNGVMYVPEKVRKGVLPRLLDEILSTRIMVKKAMKKLSSSQQVLHRIFNSRQLALKLISNVTYGYTAAGFSGRMPCAEIADGIVQCGRSTLEKAISYVNGHKKWKAKVIYGDTDSMFVLLKGRTIADSFHIGREIAAEITAMNPNPVALKMEKVYSPCFLLTKKRYVGYSYESPDQTVPIFDAKGIETVRRDTCGAVVKTMEQSLRLFFEHHDVHEVKAYLERQWKRILSGRVSLQDFVFAKEVRLGTYRASSFSSLPPAAIVATKAIRIDPRAEPRYAERIPYVVIHGEPGARLADMVVDPLNLLAIDSPYRLNDLYYIHKQIIPALQRVFGLVGADLNQWFSNMPRPARETFGKRPFYASNPQRTRIDYYYLSSHCILCGELVQGSAHLCNHCSASKDSSAVALVGRTSKLEREMQHIAAICRHCGGGDWVVDSGIKCTSLACSVFYERRKVQKELRGLASVAAETGLYPKCMVEWF